MHTKLLFLFLLLSQTLTFAQSNSNNKIRGNSWFLDVNMTLFLGQWGTNIVTPIQQGIYRNVITNGDISVKNISLTFDDAPDEINTDKLLDILRENDTKASFFMIGEKMRDENVAVVKRTYDEGHLVLNHSFDHPRMTDLNASSIDSQLNRAAERIEAITGRYPMLFRPPYGSINPLVANTADEHNMTTVLWSLDSLDWTLKDPDAITHLVTTNIHKGDIILMHCNSGTVASLPTIIKKLKEQGYTFIKLDDMLGVKAYRVNAQMMRNDQKEVVVDTKTVLMWQDNSDTHRVKKEWQGAIDYCQNLIFAGHSDWRLPIVDEFFSIRDEARKKIAINNRFKNGVGDNYWSSSDVYSSRYAWNMNFENGDDATNLKNSNFYVRCVRDNQ